MLRGILGRLSPRPEIKVGVVACHTGLAANFGITATRGLELGIEYATSGSGRVAGRPIRLLVEDDAGDADTADRKARTLIEQEGVHLLQGCTLSSSALKMARVAREYKCPFLIAVAATDVITGEWFNRYTFRTASTTFQDAATGCKYAVEHLGHTFHFLSPDYVWGHESRAAWWRAVEKYGGEIVGDLIISPDKTDFHFYLEEVLARSPEVFVPFWVGRAVKTLFIQMRGRGIFDKMKVAGNLVDWENVQAVGGAIAGMVCVTKYYYSFPHNPVNAWLVQHHQAQYSTPPDVFTESGFTAGIALVEALKRTGGDSDTEALISAMEGMRFEGPKGPYTFRPQDHQALQPMYLAEMIKPPDQPYCLPRLIREVSAEDCAPPLIEPRPR